ncbi:DNA cross-link repair 1 protein [Ananas comosus]|uniref:DNA cross-link repair 1 protein n=1 Tax=Ananas comosus TaxID=4615 RepID=A0A199VKT1_ANACO|nr:DNA cross-link repair 1 protein [Ananas comosus]
MAALPLPTPKALTLTITTSSLFLSSLSSFSAISPQTRPPLSFDLLSHGSPLPPIPSTFPRHKLIPNSRFVVDGFRSAGDFSVSYFLSHFHSDHYAGLNPSWCEGIIFCSEVTARLLKEILRVPHFFVVPLALGETVGIDGWDVTLVDANHCPGAVQFLFKGPRGWDGQRNANPARYVHTGDFRFCESMKSDSNLREFVGSDAVFLDTTYCNPKFVFPSQEESVEYVVRTIRRIRDQNKGSSESILFLIATYVVGKEKILLEISRQCDCLLHVDSRKMAILSVLGFGETGVFTEDASASHIHVIGWNLLGETWPYFRPNFVKMKEIMIERGYSRVVGFVSTGWMYETKRDGFAVRVKDSLEIHLVPYSEHSNYDELREYVSSNQQAEEEARNSAPLVSVSLGKDSDLDGLNCLNDMEVEGARKELRDFLPSWVTEEQVLDLLKYSDGDIVKAVSVFFECERDLYEEASSCSVSIPSSQKSMPTDLDTVVAKVTEEGPKYSPKKSLVHVMKPVNRNSTISSSNLPKKRSSGSGNRPKKKGKSVVTVESSGSKQSTITKFFGRVAPTVSCNDSSANINGDRHQNIGDRQGSDTVEMHMQEVDQFLQIIDGGMAREAALSLLEKAKGDINQAVDMYYSNHSDVCSGERNTVPCSTTVDIYASPNNCNEKSSNSKAKATFSNFLLALSPDDVLPAVYLCTNRIAADHENMILRLHVRVTFHMLD